MRKEETFWMLWQLWIVTILVLWLLVIIYGCGGPVKEFERKELDCFQAYSLCMDQAAEQSEYKLCGELRDECEASSDS